MAQSAELVNRTRFLAKTVLLGAAILLVLLVAIPFIVPHQSLPEPIIVFVSLFILIAALVAGTAAAYLFMSRVPAPPSAVPGSVDVPSSSDATHAPTAQELHEFVLRLLDGDERRLMRVILESRGDVLQRDLVAATAFSDAKVSRLLDRLEERGLVVRERQGMTNRVRLTLTQK